MDTFRTRYQRLNENSDTDAVDTVSDMRIKDHKRTGEGTNYLPTGQPVLNDSETDPKVLDDLGIKSTTSKDNATFVDVTIKKSDAAAMVARLLPALKPSTLTEATILPDFTEVMKTLNEGIYSALDSQDQQDTKGNVTPKDKNDKDDKEDAEEVECCDDCDCDEGDCEDCDCKKAEEEESRGPGRPKGSSNKDKDDKEDSYTSIYLTKDGMSLLNKKLATEPPFGLGSS